MKIAPLVKVLPINQLSQEFENCFTLGLSVKSIPGPYSANQDWKVIIIIIKLIKVNEDKSRIPLKGLLWSTLSTVSVQQAWDRPVKIPSDASFTFGFTLELTANQMQQHLITCTSHYMYLKNMWQSGCYENIHSVCEKRSHSFLCITST